VVGQQNADITDTLQLGDVAMATIFWLSIYVCCGDAALCPITLTTCFLKIFQKQPFWQSFYTVDPNHVGTEENSKQLTPTNHEK